MENYKFIHLTDNGQGVFKLVLARPELHNAFNDVMIEEITHAAKTLGKNQEVRLLVLSGEGKSFSAGADLNWMKSMASYSFEENVADSKALRDMFVALDELPFPVLGLAQGAALGGGVGLIAVCDYVLASEKAKFGLTEVRLGLIPAVISPFVVSKIGESWSRRWFCSGERFDAHHALSMGLVHEVVPPESFEETSLKRISEFLKAGPKASRLAKKLIKDLKESDSSVSTLTCEAIASARVSVEGQEGMQALLTKQKAPWVSKT